MRRKICIFTGTRAEYGLLRPLMEEIRSDRQLWLQIIASGMHLSTEFGLTYKEIEKDGFKISKKVDIFLDSDTPVGLAKSMGTGLIGFAEAFRRLNPDIVVILGDRFEAFSAAIAAMLLRIPIAHLHGGEATFGAIDEAIRHSITKMSYLHFTSTESYRKRVIQLGEEPKRIFNVGAIGLDNIRRLNLLSKRELEKKISFEFNKRNLLLTFHPVTLEKNSAEKQFRNLLSVLDELEDTHIIFTKANADTGGRSINRMIAFYVSKNRYKTRVFTSMGQLNYLSTMQFIDAVVGNSSSGIIEAPSFKIGTINIGDRQKGRIKAKSIIDCEPTRKSVRNAFKKLYSKEFQKNCKKNINLYEGKNTAKRIKDIIKRYDIDKIFLKKVFYDINFTNKEQ